MQQRYALALMGNARLEESRRYLNEEWSGKKKERLYKQTVLNLNLVEAYQQQEAVRYNELYDRADRSIKRNKLFGAEKLFLEHQYGDRKNAEDCMQYVLEYGNTMPCKAKAEEWFKHDREQSDSE